MTFANAVWIVVFLLGAMVVNEAFPYEDKRFEDPRFCGMENIQRHPNGDIKRDAKVLEAFQSIWPCPNTGLTTGKCLWLKDHIISLGRGGCDVVHNIGWMPSAMKSGAGKFPKDRWELKVYRYPIIITPVPVPVELPILTR